jgi:hypothetical protein
MAPLHLWGIIGEKRGISFATPSFFMLQQMAMDPCQLKIIRRILFFLLKFFDIAHV